VEIVLCVCSVQQQQRYWWYENIAYLPQSHLTAEYKHITSHNGGYITKQTDEDDWLYYVLKNHVFLKTGIQNKSLKQ